MASDRMCFVITGSASGLGAATAASLAKGGARIVINYSSSQKEAEQVADLFARVRNSEVGYWLPGSRHGSRFADPHLARE